MDAKEQISVFQQTLTAAAHCRKLFKTLPTSDADYRLSKLALDDLETSINFLIEALNANFIIK